MSNRRDFIKWSGLASAGLLLGKTGGLARSITAKPGNLRPVVVSTWIHGEAANAAAWKVLSAGGTALDAVEAGVRVCESDPKNTSVGLGGAPDREGKVSLDACIMDHESRCGAVAFLEHIENPISVARRVMEDTPHVMLVGEGALQFALEKGFKKTNLLTPASEKAYKDWLKTSQYKPIINRENHDTIGMLAIDQAGNMAGSCTTSGMAYKLHGRVGDSPIIGAGLFVDNEVGAACATGVGEAVIRVAGSAMVVELMRQGLSPEEACKEVVNRIIKKHKDLSGLQVGFLALSRHGEFGAYSIYNGFNFATTTPGGAKLIDAASDRKWD